MAAPAAGNSSPSVVVAIGGSGGRAKPIEDFIAAVPVHADVATVVVLQHREALDDRFGAHLGISEHEIITIADGMTFLAGYTYLAPPGVIVTLANGTFHVRPANQMPGERGTIDSFLVSLAEHQSARSIVVMFGETAEIGRAHV